MREEPKFPEYEMMPRSILFYFCKSENRNLPVTTLNRCVEPT